MMASHRSGFVFRELTNCLLDASCSACGTRLHGAKTQRCYCDDCVQQLRPREQHRCRRCSAECGPWSSIDRHCVYCRGRRLRFSQALSLGPYEGLLRKEILAGKWSWSSARLEALARLLGERAAAQFREWGISLLLPIPQHWTRRLQRHFNPAERIGAELSRCSGIRQDLHVITRSRALKPQKRTPLGLRFENQKGSFRIVNSHQIRGQRILLTDDVLTTGATCSMAAAALMQAGARSCHVAVLARVTDGPG